MFLFLLGLEIFQIKKAVLKKSKECLKKEVNSISLEFSKSQGENFSKIYDFYSYNFIPTIGDLVTGDRKSYEYLVKSIRTHEDQEAMLSLFEDAGYLDCDYKNIFKGIVALHRGTK